MIQLLQSSFVWRVRVRVHVAMTPPNIMLICVFCRLQPDWISEATGREGARPGRNLTLLLSQPAISLWPSTGWIIIIIKITVGSESVCAFRRRGEGRQRECEIDGSVLGKMVTRDGYIKTSFHASRYKTSHSRKPNLSSWRYISFEGWGCWRRGWSHSDPYIYCSILCRTFTETDFCSVGTCFLYFLNLKNSHFKTTRSQKTFKLNNIHSSLWFYFAIHYLSKLKWLIWDNHFKTAFQNVLTFFSLPPMKDGFF